MFCSPSARVRLVIREVKAPAVSEVEPAFSFGEKPPRPEQPSSIVIGVSPGTEGVPDQGAKSKWVRKVPQEGGLVSGALGALLEVQLQFAQGGLGVFDEGGGDLAVVWV